MEQGKSFEEAVRVAQEMGVADMENDRSLLSSFEQQTHYLSTDKTGSAGNQYCHGNLIPP